MKPLNGLKTSFFLTLLESVCVEDDLRQKLGLVPLQSLQSIQEEGGFSESQEASDVRGRQGHHLTVLIQQLGGGEGTEIYTFFLGI